MDCSDKKVERADAAVTALVMTERLAAWSSPKGYVRYMATGAAHCAVKGTHLSYFAANAARYAAQARYAAEGLEEKEAQLVRNIFGNPFPWIDHELQGSD